MVGKSNKFDFSNRSNSGVNLARVIGDAFIKELEKAKKDATRQANKLRKQSSDAAATVDSSKDISVHVIDLKVPGKELSDEGVNIMVEGIHTALLAGTEDASLSLQHINLRDNGLTMNGVRHLTRIIFPLSKNLKTLNLSNNSIKVETNADKISFESILTYLRLLKSRCYLDLGGNQELGWGAWEIVARVYMLHSIVREPVIHRHNMPLSMFINTEAIAEQAYYDEEERELAIREAVTYCHQVMPSMNITNTGLNDAGALWLSFFRADNSITFINDSANTAALESEIDNEASTRVDWSMSGNALGKDGLQLLRWIEDMDAQRDAQTSANQTQALTAPGKVRRASGRQSTSSNADDIVALRHKMQRHIIHHIGARRVQLWRTALLCIAFSRKMFLLATDISHRLVRSDSKTDENFEQYLTTAAQAVSSRTRISSPRVIRIKTSTLGEPAAPLADISNSSSPMHKSSKKSTKQKSSIGTLASELNNVKLALASTTTNRFRKWQKEKSANKPYADDTVACRLPYAIFLRIFQDVALSRYPRTLKPSKCELAYRWGQNRSTLTTEREWIRMTESAQILTLLDSVKCLSYVD